MSCLRKWPRVSLEWCEEGNNNSVILQVLPQDGSCGTRATGRWMDAGAVGWIQEGSSIRDTAELEVLHV